MSEFEYLTIGRLVQKLQPTYPDLTVSKVRYLEDEGLLHPLRSTGGYRKYSPNDVARLESILYMQKHRFYPLAVIKEQLERQEREGSKKAVDAVTESVEEVPFVDSPEMVGKLHPIDRMPEICGTPVSFVRSLADAGLIQFKKSPQGRDLVEGRDLALIRACDELRTFGIGPKNLRQYVMAANRESAMFEQALVVYTAKAGGVEADRSEEMRARADEAFNRMLALTNTLRTILIKRLVRNTPSNE